jgi:hypothetical protein
MNDDPEMSMDEAISIARRKIAVIEQIAEEVATGRNGPPNPALAASHRKAATALRLLVDWAQYG